MAEAKSQGEIPASFVTKKSVKPKKPKKVKADNSERVALEVQPASVEPPLEELAVPEKKQERSGEAMVLEQAQKSQQGKVEMPPVQYTKTLEAETVSQSSSNCQYGFGYLNQRKKGGQIPDMCMVCPKLLKCMLHDRYKKESVAEIKKLQAP